LKREERKKNELNEKLLRRGASHTLRSHGGNDASSASEKLKDQGENKERVFLQISSSGGVGSSQMSFWIDVQSGLVTTGLSCGRGEAKR